MLKRLILALLILDLSFHGFKLLSKFKKKPEEKPPVVRIEQVETMPLKQTDHTLRIESQGTVRAATSGVLGTEVSGKILKVSESLQEGGRFGKGDLLLTIDPIPYEAALAKAQADYSRAVVAFKEEEARAEQALKEWQAAQTLTTEKPSSLVLRKPQLELAKAQLLAAEKAVELAGQNLEKTKVQAPYSGVVVEKLVETGQVVAPGTPLAQIYGSDAMEVPLPLSALETGFLDLANQHTVTLHVENGQGHWTWQGTIDRNSGSVDPKTRLHRYIAKIDTNNEVPGRPELLPGQFVTATIDGPVLPKVFRIPRHAYRNDGSVYLVTKGDTLLKRDIQILFREQDHLIVDKGLAPGETLCLSRLPIMNDKMKVRRAGNKAKE